ncbi:MAG: HEAT repeat domain-containing protein, partial [Planctomycetota bacterium]
MMRRAWISAIGFLFLWTVAGGIDLARGGEVSFKKANRTYQIAMQRIKMEEAKFWKEAQKRLREAYETFRSQWIEWYGKPDAPADIFYDLSGYKTLYSEAEAFGDRKGAAAETLAGVDGEETAKALFGQLVFVNGKVAKLEKKLKTARAIVDDYHIDQEPVLRRLMNERHRAGLLRAVGKLTSPEAVAFLTEKGWKDAGAADKRDKGLLNRLALLDAVSVNPSDGAFAFMKNGLEEEDLYIRIAALEGMARYQKTKADEVMQAALRVLKEEKTFPIKLTALRILEAMKPIKAIGPLIELLKVEEEGKGGGILCGHVIRILTALTEKNFGMNWINWQGWYGKRKAAIDAGTWK